MRPVLRGKVTDYGDLLHHEEWIVKGKDRLGIRWHLGPTAETTAADRTVRGTAYPSTGKADLTMDLMADQQVPLSIEWTDEVGNVTTAPADATVVYTVDDTEIINLTENGDGTAVAAAVGALGTANVHVEGRAPSGNITTGDLAIVVVAGLADRLNIVAGEPEEITPDV